MQRYSWQLLVLMMMFGTATLPRPRSGLEPRGHVHVLIAWATSSDTILVRYNLSAIIPGPASYDNLSLGCLVAVCSTLPRFIMGLVSGFAPLALLLTFIVHVAMGQGNEWIRLVGRVAP